MFTAERLQQLCPYAHADIVDAVVPALEKFAPAFETTTSLRRAHLMAQIAHESAGFTRLAENLNYSAERIPVIWPRLAARAVELAHQPEALANAAYANHLGNSDEASGDGWRYRGRGLIQITGRDNYRARGVVLRIDLVADPERAAEPDTAVRVALSFWQSHHCNEAADRDDIKAITRAINGAVLEGLAARRALAERAKEIFV